MNYLYPYPITSLTVVPIRSFAPWSAGWRGLPIRSYSQFYAYFFLQNDKKFLDFFRGLTGKKYLFFFQFLGPKSVDPKWCAYKVLCLKEHENKILQSPPVIRLFFENKVLIWTFRLTDKLRLKKSVTIKRLGTSSAKMVLLASLAAALRPEFWPTGCRASCFLSSGNISTTNGRNKSPPWNSQYFTVSAIFRVQFECRNRD